MTYKVWAKVAQLSFETGGNFSLSNTKGKLPSQATPDVMENGASHLCHGIFILIHWTLFNETDLFWS